MSITLEYGDELEIINEADHLELTLTVWDEQLRLEFTSNKNIMYKELSENTSRYLINNTIDEMSTEIQSNIEEMWENMKND